VELRAVTVRYPRAREDAIAGVSLCVRPRRRTVLLGPNGSGKSTLARLLAGSPPTSGTVRRPGPVGLGRPGGTALVSQQPESQVLGVRVADDVVWGLPADWPVDVDALLAEVGLAGLASRETSALSGGQLQRLALAAAIARRPQLLIADEVTAMVDAAGREEIVALLRHLPAHHAVAVVQVTHRVGEVAGADRVTVLQRGRIVSEGRPEEMPGARAALGASPATPAAAGPSLAPDRPAAEAVAPLARSRHQPGVPPPGVPRPGGTPLPGPLQGPLPAPLPAPLLVVDEVSHTYAARTPWAQPALHDVSLSLAAGDGILVLGDNGSGKSTLAWVMAGLLRPSAGECLLGGRPVTDQVGRVALAFQHARLQVLGTTVGADVRAAGGVGTDAGKAALRQLGLDPAALWDRPVDELSGGQLRRVALAGLLAGDPRVVILDEPLAGLDEESRAALLDGLARLRSERGLTLVVISHDLEAATICDRLLRLDAGRPAGEERLAGAGRFAGAPAPIAPTAGPDGPACAACPAGRDEPSAGRDSRRSRRRPPRELVLLRRVEVDSPVHRLWAGAKLLAVVAVSVTVSEDPTWPVAGVLAAGLLTVALLARIPASAVPRLPRWIWVGWMVFAFLTLAAGGRPEVTLGGERLGVGSLGAYVLFTVVAVELLAAGALIGWTTALGDVGPAVVTLGRPLRWLRLPVEEWAVAIALCIRSLPLLVGELRVVVAVRRLRPRRPGRPTLPQLAEDGLEVLATALAVAVRRAGEMGEAMTARGGAAGATARVPGPRGADAAAVVVVAVVCAGAWLLP
jgi:energy-coupling factor transport system ATP-binding protein